MDIRKAAFVALLLLAACLWSASLGVVPLPPPVEDFAVGIIGVVGLGLAAILRAFAAVAMPLLVVLRILIVPLVLVGIGYLIFREFRRARN